MIRSIVESSLKLRVLVIAGAAVVMVAGVGQLQRMPVDVLPEFAPPYVEIQTEALGLSANEVEDLVTLNVEELLAGVPWLQTMRSRSVPGLSSVVMIFEPGTDLMRARQMVQEPNEWHPERNETQEQVRAALRQLPEVAEHPPRLTIEPDVHLRGREHRPELGHVGICYMSGRCMTRRCMTSRGIIPFEKVELTGALVDNLVQLGANVRQIVRRELLEKPGVKAGTRIAAARLWYLEDRCHHRRLKIPITNTTNCPVFTPRKSHQPRIGIGLG